MKHLALLAVLFIYFTNLSFAQNDPAADKLLQQVSDKFKLNKTFKAEFTFILENVADSIYDVQKGLLYLKGDMYRLELGGQEISSNNKDVWTYLKEANEVQINKVDLNDKDAFRPSDIFTIYKEGFKYRILEEQVEKGKTMQYIDLTPIKNDKSYFKILLTIDKATKSLVSSRVFDKNGNRYTYRIDKFIANPVLEDKFFSFDTSKHPGIEIVDLR